jgi:hypothetical protein
MSRYTLQGQHPRFRLQLGWDPLLSSYYAQVEDLAWESGGAVIDEETIIGDSLEEGLLVWVGADRPVHTVEEIVLAAVADYGSIPQEVLAQLRKDKEENRPMTGAHLPPEIIRAAGRRYRKLAESSRQGS